MGHLGSGVWVTASFQIFALTAGGECLVVRVGDCLGKAIPTKRNVEVPNHS